MSPLLSRIRGCCDHVEQFKQSLDAIRVATFKLTLGDQASICFQTRSKNLSPNANYIVKDFLTNFTRRGINGFNQFFSHKQEGKETIKDYIHHTTRLHSPCNPGDKMTNDKLMNQFINKFYSPTLQKKLIAHVR